MRVPAFVIALSAVLGTAVHASAQTPLAGPLAAPDASSPAATTAKPAKAKSAHHKAKTTRHAKSEPMNGAPPRPDRSEPVLHSPSNPASDPVSLGMKWNGNNDSAQQTRVQNYNGGATGTGGELGLKFHF